MSTAKFDTLSTLDGSRSVPVNTVAQGSAKAWVNFNGTGAVAIRAAFNVTSITDGGTGTYTINFTTALPDGNYATELFCNVSLSLLGLGMLLTTAPSTTAVSIRTFNQSFVATDNEFVNVAIFD
jgi:hypothetical protein